MPEKIDCERITDPELKKSCRQLNPDIDKKTQDEIDVGEEVADATRDTIIEIVEKIIGGLIIAAAIIIADPIQLWVEGWSLVAEQPKWISQIIVFVVFLVIIVAISLLLIFYKRRIKTKR